MPEIVMYTTGMCPYCVRAKMLLQRKGMDWEEKRIDLDRGLMGEMLQRSNRRTVPQIFVGEANFVLLRVEDPLAAWRVFAARPRCHSATPSRR